MMNDGSTSGRTYRMSELVALSGISERNIRHYMNIGMVEKALTRGAGAVYGQHVLDKLLAIKKLKTVFVHQLDRHLSLKEIDLALQSGGLSNRWREVVGEDESTIARDWGGHLASLIGSPSAEASQPAEVSELTNLILEAIAFLTGQEFIGLPADLHKRFRSENLEIDIRMPEDIQARRSLATQAHQLSRLLTPPAGEEPLPTS